MGLSGLSRVGFALICLSIANLSWAQLTGAEILNRAAQQRTLVLSAAKHYVLAASGVDVRQSQLSLESVKKQFEANLNVMRINAPNTVLRESLKSLDAEWNAFNDQINAPASNSRVESIVEATNKLVFLADAISNRWGVDASGRELEALNLSHLQAMLSERMGMLYAAHYFGLKSDWVVMELNETLQAYESSLEYLERFASSDKAVQVHLEQVRNQWVYAKQGFAKFNQGHYLPKVIAVTVDSMQNQMGQVAHYYSNAQPVSTQPFSTLSVPGLAANAMEVE
ncbi:MAG: hypothetical protein MI976_12585 [Pseudomonadales bacterium]|nr:hypothetical protein [Pseudomonadales bacterium]